MHQTTAGRHSAVGIATHYGLDVPGIGSQGARDFLHLTLGLTHPPSLYSGYLVFPGIKATGECHRQHTPI
jgi:hypothetical protein